MLPAIRQAVYIAVNGTETNEEPALYSALIVANDAIKRKDALSTNSRQKPRFADAVAAADGTCLVK